MIIGELLTNRSRRRRKTKPALSLRPDDRPWNGPDPLAAVYLYGPDRKAALRHLCWYGRLPDRHRQAFEAESPLDD
jgi:hypothetical protein